jgi:cysteinyl-tRNA synthetase
MDDDFNTGGAIGVLHELLTTLNKFAEDTKADDPAARNMDLSIDFGRGTAVLRELSGILGLFWAPIETAKSGDDALVNELMQLLIDLRAEARKAKNFALGDQIRKRLTELGVTLEDRSGGTSWRKE